MLLRRASAAGPFWRNSNLHGFLTGDYVYRQAHGTGIAMDYGVIAMRVMETMSQ
jgi:hypothetical protein